MCYGGALVRELSVDLFSTVDAWGSGRESEGYFGLLGPELQAWIDEKLAEPHVMVMGANTYRAMAEIVATVDDPTFPRMAELPKLVFSKTLKPPLTWANTTVVAEDVATALPAMKAEADEPMRVVGSYALTRGLFRAGLVDRLRLIVFPQVLGQTGEERILTGLPDLDLELTDSRALDGRLVLLDYRVGATRRQPA
jgi:dihydrofolate reductase